MTGPTPGPWFTSPVYKDDFDIPCVDVGPIQDRSDHEQYEDAICQVIGANHDAEANAHLIASAPDLLEALKYARRFLKPGNDMAFVDAAIAKAQPQERDGQNAPPVRHDK